ncbi:MAG: beta-glucosidase [Gemmatimonadaceae bacterium]|nr:beta-glucosidase [Gemmatimonadaceae bacterium]
MPATPEEGSDFFIAGFESASQRRADGARLDLVQATAHDRWAATDYRQCGSLGLRTVRDGLRWHRIESRPGLYDWSSWTPMLEAAEEIGVRVIWTLHHYGAPDHLCLGNQQYVDRFSHFAAAVVKRHREITGRPALICPMNEISFHAWAVGVNYFANDNALDSQSAKRCLVQAALAAVRSMRSADTACRMIWSEPLIHVAPHSALQERPAEQYRLAQFEAYEMLMGSLEPELGGTGDIVESIGLNYYPHNQWYFEGSTIALGHHAYRPLADMLAEVHERFARPVWIAETGAEGSARAAWLHYVCDEVRAAEQRGVPITGVCLFPVTCYPGWDDARSVETGLLTAANAAGERTIYAPLLQELQRQRTLRAIPAQFPTINLSLRRQTQAL